MLTRLTLITLALATGFATQARAESEVIAKSITCGSEFGRVQIDLVTPVAPDTTIYGSRAEVYLEGPNGLQPGYPIGGVVVAPLDNGGIRISDNDDAEKALIFLEDSSASDTKFVSINGVKIELVKCDPL